MNYEWLDFLRKEYAKLTDLHYCTIKRKIVYTFLANLGYEKEYFKEIENTGYIDIFASDFSSKNKIIIRALEGNSKIGNDVFEHFVNTLFNSQIDWGIVCNGKDFILVNSKIDGEYEHKKVLQFNLRFTSTEDYLEYFSFNSIFKSKVTNYFLYLMQFKSYKLRESNKISSWISYESVLLNFFKYMAEKKHYRELEHIDYNDFKEFITYEIDLKKKEEKRYAQSIHTIFNKFAYIKGFYDTLIKNGVISNNPFDLLSNEKKLEGIEYIEENEEFEPLQEDEINKILSYYENYQDSERNKLIFLLCLYAGLSRGEIRNLQEENIDLEKKYLCVGEKTVPLSEGIAQKLKDYIISIKDDADFSGFVFYSNYSKYKSGPLSENAINNIIKGYSKYFVYPLPIERQKQITPEFLKKSLVKRMFKNKFTIEEILKLTDLELSTIARYIATSEIKDKTNLDKMLKFHPYKDFF
ncbi:site-specific recombinase XerD [Anaerobacterium chartisolvens]|uniref:Site-specific recombinase XerD n=1 Tax=Anaerobacterium chartisolvens TaxID=1297424 RepID=A0A369B4J1_9FIRM|nr:site-specific integrase [Anaerobacterium chartisolvens]RCX16393.1 site-specific recombinase XerD [Anaerobacterium chartisolvens]